ncbi:hypothetical protein J7K41_01175 [Candidatus Micrarchaeota archaeon]|nr:hypothetical protein [Candidatus Micrarchaeota archaeon]
MHDRIILRNRRTIGVIVFMLLVIAAGMPLAACPPLTEYSSGIILATDIGDGSYKIGFYEEVFNSSLGGYQRTPVENALLYMYAPDSHGNITMCYAVTGTNGTVYINIPETFHSNCTTLTTVYCYNVCPDDPDFAEKIFECTGINITELSRPVRSCGTGGGTLSCPYSVNRTIYAPSKEVRYCKPVAASLEEWLCLPVFLIIGLLAGALYLSGVNPFNMFAVRGGPRFKTGTYRMRKRRGASFSVSSLMYAGLTAKETAKGIKEAGGLRKYLEYEWKGVKDFLKSAYVEPFSRTKELAKEYNIGLKKLGRKTFGRRTVRPSEGAEEESSQPQEQSFAVTPGTKGSGPAVVAGAYKGTVHRAVKTFAKKTGKDWLAVTLGIAYAVFGAPFLNTIAPGMSTVVLRKIDKSNARKLADALITGRFRGKKIDWENTTAENGNRVAVTLVFRDEEGNVIGKLRVGWDDIQTVDARFSELTNAMPGILPDAIGNVAWSKRLADVMAKAKESGNIPRWLKDVVGMAREGSDRDEIIKAIMKVIPNRTAARDLADEIIKLADRTDAEVINQLYSWSVLHQNEATNVMKQVMGVFGGSIMLALYPATVGPNIELPDWYMKISEEIENKKKELEELEKSGASQEEINKKKAEIVELIRLFEQRYDKEKEKLRKVIADLAITEVKTIGYMKKLDKALKAQLELAALEKARMEMEGKVTTVHITYTQDGETRTSEIDVVDLAHSTGAQAARLKLSLLSQGYWIYSNGGMDGLQFSGFIDNTLSKVTVPSLADESDIYNPVRVTDWALDMKSASVRFGAALGMMEPFNKLTSQERNVIAEDEKTFAEYKKRVIQIGNWVNSFDDRFVSGLPEHPEPEVSEAERSLNDAVRRYSEARERGNNEEAAIALTEIRDAQNQIQKGMGEDENYLEQSTEYVNELRKMTDNVNEETNFLVSGMAATVSFFRGYTVEPYDAESKDLYQKMEEDYWKASGQFDMLYNSYLTKDTYTPIPDNQLNDYYSTASESILTSIEYHAATYETWREEVQGIKGEQKPYEKEVAGAVGEMVKALREMKLSGREEYSHVSALHNQWMTVEGLLMERGIKPDKKVMRDWKELDENTKNNIKNTKRLNELFNVRKDYVKSRNTAVDWMKKRGVYDRYETHVNAISRYADFYSENPSETNIKMMRWIADNINTVSEKVKKGEMDEETAGKKLLSLERTLERAQEEKDVLMLGGMLSGEIAVLPAPSELEAIYGKDDPDVKEYRKTFEELMGDTRISDPLIPVYTLPGDPSIWMRTVTRTGRNLTPSKARRTMKRLKTLAKKITGKK